MKNSTTEFFPAAFDFAQFYDKEGGLQTVDIRSVVATDIGGSVVLWNEDDTPVVGAPSPAWADHKVIGTELIGYGEDRLGIWRGSSFATAIAAALYASGVGLDSIDTAATTLARRPLSRPADLNLCVSLLVEVGGEIWCKE